MCTVILYKVSLNMALLCNSVHLHCRSLGVYCAGNSIKWEDEIFTHTHMYMHIKWQCL